jgi:hypothetical protein
VTVEPTYGTATPQTTAQTSRHSHGQQAPISQALLGKFYKNCPNVIVFLDTNQHVNKRGETTQGGMDFAYINDGHKFSGRDGEEFTQGSCEGGKRLLDAPNRCKLCRADRESITM